MTNIDKIPEIATTPTKITAFHGVGMASYAPLKNRMEAGIKMNEKTSKYLLNILKPLFIKTTKKNMHDETVKEIRTIKSAPQLVKATKPKKIKKNETYSIPIKGSRIFIQPL